MNEKNKKNILDYSSSSVSINEIIEIINKEFGEGTVTTLGKISNNRENVISSGSIFLNNAMGTGGYVRGKIVEIFGLESSGKSTLALQAVNECQKKNGKVAYFDLENGLDREYAKKIGIEIDDLMIFYPDSGEKVFDMMKNLIRGNIDLIIVDSVSNLIPFSQLDSNLEKQKIGSQALLMSSGLRRLKNELISDKNLKNTVIIFINQIRNKISTGFYLGNPETTSGGMALRFDSDLRIKLKKRGFIEKEDNDEVIGIKVEAEIIKNKLAAPGKTADIEIFFSKGIKKEREIFHLAVKLEIIEKSGNWYSYLDKKIGNGKENSILFLENNFSIYEEIENKVIKEIKNNKLFF